LKENIAYFKPKPKMLGFLLISTFLTKQIVFTFVVNVVARVILDCHCLASTKEHESELILDPFAYYLDGFLILLIFKLIINSSPKQKELVIFVIFV